MHSFSPSFSSGSGTRWSVAPARFWCSLLLRFFWATRLCWWASTGLRASSGSCAMWVKSSMVSVPTWASLFILTLSFQIPQENTDAIVTKAIDLWHKYCGAPMHAVWVAVTFQTSSGLFWDLRHDWTQTTFDELLSWEKKFENPNTGNGFFEEKKRERHELITF